MKSKKACLVAAIIIIIPTLASCIRLEFTKTTPEYSEQPEVTLSPAPEPSLSPSPSPAPECAFAVQDASGNKPVYNSAGRPRYDINIKFDQTEHTAAAAQTVVYTNNSAGSLSELYMHIYPNHFSKKAYVDMEFMGYEAYPDEKFDPGYIKIKSVKASGKPVKFEVQGEDETILRIPLKAPLKKGSSIKLRLEYSLRVPHRIGRYAWGDVGTSFGNWYPVMAVYDDEGWNLDKYYELGDPFYSETADYNVTIDMPEGMSAAFTGDILSDTVAYGRRVLSLSETGVRDFAFALSRHYVIDTEMVDGIEVRVAIPKKNEGAIEDVISYAKKSLTIYNSRFGRYTNDSLTVAFTDFFSGMEYPGIVLIAASYFEYGEEALPVIENVIAHEIGHQWWYSAVGNDEVDESWLDEGLASFTESVYYGKDLSRETMPDPLPESGDVKPLNSSLTAFEGWGDYYYVYSFGKSFFIKLLDKMGENEFYTMLQKYYADYAYEIATADGLRSLVAEAGNTAALEWYDKCVYGK